MLTDGFQWDEFIVDSSDPVYSGLVSLMAIKDDGIPHLIGTAFIVEARGNRALAISAAHCIEDLRKILHPNPIHHPSALEEFLPPPEELELERLKGIYLFGDKLAICSVELAIWDVATDVAGFTLLAPDSEEDLFQARFSLTEDVPDVGDYVAMIGFGELKVIPDENEKGKGNIEKRIIVRIGRVEEICFDRPQIYVKGPWVKTSIPIFSGMSGGIVSRFTGLGSSIEPFAIISHSPGKGSAYEDETVYDRAKSGESVGSIIRMNKSSLPQGGYAVSIPLNNIRTGRIFPKDTEESAT